MVKKEKMKMDLARIPSRYSGKWVAISLKTNKVVFSGENPKEVFEKLKVYLVENMEEVVELALCKSMEDVGMAEEGKILPKKIEKQVTVPEI